MAPPRPSSSLALMNTNLPAVSRPQPGACSGTARFTLKPADKREREMIYRLRHEVYARELRQHDVNATGLIRDTLDDWNFYLVAKIKDTIAGFISLTPPGRPSYSIDKYFARPALPFAVDRKRYEVRLLTVLKPHRGCELAILLMYAALRWVEAHDGERIVSIGRREVLDLYLKAGLERTGQSVQAGAVTYDLLHATARALREKMLAYSGLLTRLEERTDWQLSFPMAKPT